MCDAQLELRCDVSFRGYADMVTMRSVKSEMNRVNDDSNFSNALLKK